MKNVFITIGVQGSGKSTIAKGLVLQLPGTTSVIEKDNIRLGLQIARGGRNDVVVWPEYNHTVDEPMVNVIQEHLLTDLLTDVTTQNIIISDTHSSEKQQLKVIKSIERIAAAYNVHVVIEWIYVATDIEVCHKRNAAREYPVPAEVLDMAFNNLKLMHVVGNLTKQENGKTYLHQYPLNIINN